MRHIKPLILTPEERVTLEEGFKNGPTPRFRRRCHGLLLKSSGKSNEQIGEILDCSHVSVYNWQKDFIKGGISELLTKSVQRRKPLLTKEKDEETVRKAVKENR